MTQKLLQPYYVLKLLLAKNDFVLYAYYTLNDDFQSNHMS